MKHATIIEGIIQRRTWAMALGAVAGAALVAACGSGSGASGGDTVAVTGDVPIAYAMRANTVGLNPTDGYPFAAGGDLMVREKSSPSAMKRTQNSYCRCCRATRSATAQRTSST